MRLEGLAAERRIESVKQEGVKLAMENKTLKEKLQEAKNNQQLQQAEKQQPQHTSSRQAEMAMSMDLIEAKMRERKMFMMAMQM